MAPPSEDSQNRRPSRRPPPRFSPGPTQKSGGGVHPRNKSVPPPSSQDDVVGRVKEAFSRTVPKLLQLPEADFNLPDSILKLKMSSKTRSKSKPPTEEPKEKKTLRSRKSEPSPKGRKSTFSTPKLPGESSRGNDSVIYSPAAKRPRIMPKKYRDEPEPPPKPRRKKVPIPEDQEIVYGDNPFGTRTIWGDRGPSQGNSTKNAAVKNTISPEDDPEWSESSGSDDEHPEPKVLNTTKHRNSGGKSMFSVATPEKVAPVDEAAGSRKGLRAKSVFENDRNAPSTSKKSDSELFKTPELPGRRSGVGIVSPAGLVKRVPRGSTANGVSPSQRTPEDPNLKPAVRQSRAQSVLPTNQNEDSIPVKNAESFPSPRRTLRPSRRSSRAQSMCPNTEHNGPERKSDESPLVSKPQEPEEGDVQQSGSEEAAQPSRTLRSSRRNSRAQSVQPCLGKGEQPKPQKSPAGRGRSRLSSEALPAEKPDPKPATRRSRAQSVFTSIKKDDSASQVMEEGPTTARRSRRSAVVSKTDKEVPAPSRRSSRAQSEFPKTRREDPSPAPSPSRSTLRSSRRSTRAQSVLPPNVAETQSRGSVVVSKQDASVKEKGRRQSRAQSVCPSSSKKSRVSTTASGPQEVGPNPNSKADGTKTTPKTRQARAQTVAKEQPASDRRHSTRSKSRVSSASPQDILKPSPKAKRNTRAKSTFQCVSDEPSSSKFEKTTEKSTLESKTSPKTKTLFRSAASDELDTIQIAKISPNEVEQHEKPTSRNADHVDAETETPTPKRNKRAASVRPSNPEQNKPLRRSQRSTASSQPEEAQPQSRVESDTPETKDESARRTLRPSRRSTRAQSVFPHDGAEAKSSISQAAPKANTQKARKSRAQSVFPTSSTETDPPTTSANTKLPRSQPRRMSVRSIKKEGRANNEEESNNPHPNDNKKAGDESADHNLSSAQGNVDEPHSEQPKEGREVAQPEEEPKTTRPRRSARAQSVALAKSDPKKPESVKRMPTRSRKAVKQEESSKIDEPMEMTHSQLHDIETQAAKTRSSEEEPIEQSLSADPKGHPASASKPAVSSPEILNPVTENNHKLPAKQADPPAMSGFEESDPEDAPTVKRDEVQVSDAYETPKKGVGTPETKRPELDSPSADENSKPEGSDPDVVFIEPKKPVETGPPVPFKGQTRAQYNALNPFVAPPCDLEVNARLKDVYVQPEDEDEFINQIASEPLPFELREKPSTSRTTLRPSRRESAKSPKKTPSAPKKEAAPKKNTPSKKETAAAKVEKEESPKATPPSKPPRKAPTNITPNKPSQKKTPVMKKEEPEEPEEEEEPQAEEPPAPKTPKGRGGRKSAAKTTPVKTEDGADFRMPEPVVRELTPAASGSGRPQRQRKIPAKFSEDVVLESAVLNNSVPELRKEPKTRPTRTQRKSMSVAPDEPKKPKRKSICEPETPKEDSVPCAPHEEVVPDETKDPKEEATSPDELPETVAPEPTVEEAPMPEAPAEKTAEATPETKVEDTTVVESDISKETPSNEATSASEPAHEPAESDVKADIIPFAIEIPKMEEEDLAALESSSSSETLLATAPNSSVRSSGRVRKKPPERDFYPGQHYANRSEPRRKSQKVSESDEYDIDPNLLAEILSHTEKLEKTICSPKGAGEVAEVAVEAVVPPPQPTKGVKRKRTESEITTEGSEPTETKPKSKKIVKKPSEVVFKTPLPPKPRAPRKISILESPIPAELKVETPSTPSTPMNFPVILSGPQLEMKNYNQPEQFFTVDHWNSSEYSDYLEFIEERQKSNSQSVGLGFLRETLPSTEDFFYREVLRSGGDLKRVDSSPMKRMNVEKSEIDVCETEELRQKDLMTADPAERIAKDIVDFLPRPKKEISAPEGEAMEVDDDDDHMWNIEDAKALAQKHENPRFSRLLNDVINVISAQFVSFVSSFGRDGGPAIYYSHSVENGRRLGNLLHRCIGDEKDFPNAIHEWMIRNLPLEFLARYLDIVRFLAEQNKQNDLIMHMMSIGTDVMVNSCHNWVLEFTLAQTADPHTDLVKHSLKTVKLHEVVFVIVHPNLTRAPSTKAHVAMFRDLLPGIAEHVDVKLNCPDDLTKNYDILCYTVDTVIQEVEETLQRYPNHHVVVAAWGVACRIVQKALQDVAGVTATLMFAYPNEAIAADPDDDANLTYCPSLFIAGENTCADYIKRLKTTRSLMIADTGLVVVANADRNLLVSATRLGIERLSQRTVDRAIVEHVYDFLKLVMKQANSNMRQHRKEMAPLDMAAFMEASNTTIEDHKIKKTLFQSPSTARSSASRHKS